MKTIKNDKADLIKAEALNAADLMAALARNLAGMLRLHDALWVGNKDYKCPDCGARTVPSGSDLDGKHEIEHLPFCVVTKSQELVGSDG